ncbi:MAG: hypothetical protein IPL79_14275 [Myxococcales bacterium]|nr:hypothetical protein [Myxococcales bacterium]
MILGRLCVVILLCCGPSCYRAPSASDLDPDAAPDGGPDAQPDSPDDAPGDGNPDAPPDSPTDGPGCSPACSADDTQLLTCNGNAPGPTIDCAIACGDTPSPHCLQPILSNDVEAGIPAGIGALVTSCGGDKLVFFSDGKITQASRHDSQRRRWLG